ncbi:hypothetical protein ND748_02025 [Frankia sp. AiPs1]|uniref:hypothetical protein n=1 Tax=Frankia sp. AiPs1 TaxID=573493 RepID=UPI00204387A2|nr:hypothetical protein [Frankia sp. AiPs1]MCM3920465.1 hypothetical protein [Frankia sp. AiPs1]
MKMWAQRTARCLGILAVVGGVALAAASPASAAAPNKAIGFQATGLIPGGPFPASAFPGTSPNSVVGLSLLPLLNSGAVSTAATPTSASVAVSGLAAALGPVAAVTAGTVTSSCFYNPFTGTVSGTADIRNGTILLFGVPITIQPNPAPGTTIVLPGNLGALAINQQTIAADGTLTVDALALSLPGGIEHAVVARSVCNRANLA